MLSLFLGPVISLAAAPCNQLRVRQAWLANSQIKSVAVIQPRGNEAICDNLQVIKWEEQVEFGDISSLEKATFHNRVNMFVKF